MYVLHVQEGTIIITNADLSTTKIISLEDYLTKEDSVTELRGGDMLMLDLQIEVWQLRAQIDIINMDQGRSLAQLEDFVLHKNCKCNYDDGNGCSENFILMLK